MKDLIKQEQNEHVRSAERENLRPQGKDLIKQEQNEHVRSAERENLRPQGKFD